VFGLEFRLDGVPVHGNTDVGILRAYFEQAGLPAAEWRSRLPQALEFMSAEVERNAEDLCPEVCRGIPDVLQRLSDTGKLLGVASGNLERVGWAKLRPVDCADTFPSEASPANWKNEMTSSPTESNRRAGCKAQIQQSASSATLRPIFGRRMPMTRLQ